MSAQAPPLALVGTPLLRFVGNLSIVSHDIGFDLGFLAQFDLFRQNLAVDTFDLAAGACPRQERYNLTTLATRRTSPSPTRTRAGRRPRQPAPFPGVDRGRQSPGARCAGRDSPPDRSQPVGLAPHLSRNGSPYHLHRPASRHPPGHSDTPRSTDRELQRGAPPRRVPTALDVDTLADFLAPGGPLTAIFPGYEHRPQQVDMLRGVADTFK